MQFWDSSAIVPLLVAEPASAWLKEAYRKASKIAVWWGTRVECVSAIMRLDRSAGLAPEARDAALAGIAALAARWEEIQPYELVREHAERLLHAHGLRAADALQLAAAGVAAEQRPATLEFVCLDGRLAQAAEREGFPLVRGI